MAHLIDMSNNRANMAFVGQKPWHGLGFEIDATASNIQWLETAGLNFKVVKEPMFLSNGLEVPGKIALVRDDTNSVLSVMGNGYQPHQTEEITQTFREVVDALGYQMETMGSLDNGRKIWALAKTGENFTLGKNDTVKQYLLIATSFDGSLATIAKQTSIRVVCNNTLSFATGRGSGADSYRVSHKSKFNPIAVKKALGMDSGEIWQLFQKQAKALTERPINGEEAHEYFLRVLYPQECESFKAEHGAADFAALIQGDARAINAANSVEDTLSTRAKNRVTELDRLMTGAVGQNLETADGTAWGALNAVTYYVDHQAARNQNNRLNSAFFGKGEQIKQHALNEAMKLV